MKTFDFSKALKLLKKGKKVYATQYPSNGGSFFEIRKGKICIIVAGKYCLDTFVISEMALDDDWYLVE